MPKQTPKSRRARGTGSIFRDARRGGWVARVPVGRTPLGKMKYKEVRASSQEAVIAKMRAVEPPSPSITLAAWCDRWLPVQHLRVQSRRAYATEIAQRIKPTLGAVPVSRLTAFQVEEAIRTWGRTVGAGTIRLSVQVLGSVMQGALRAGIITINPVRQVRKPALAKQDMNIFTLNELARIIAAASARPAWRVWAVCAALGCRIGEALALERSDYHPATGQLSISRTFHQHTRSIGPAKSKNSIRTITVPRSVRPLLAAGITRTTYGPALEAWARLLDSLRLTYRNPHQLRHSVASHMVAAGLPLPDVAAYLGDSLATIVATYTHPTGVDCGERFGDLLSGSKVARAIPGSEQTATKHSAKRR